MNAHADRVPPRFGESPEFQPIWLWVILVAAFAGGTVLFLFNPAQSRFYPFCLFHQATGLLCPGCGSLRAMHQLLHLHLAAALRCNALLVSSLPLMAWWTARLVHARITHRPAAIIIRPSWLWCALALLIVFAVIRNLPFHPFAWLSP